MQKEKRKKKSDVYNELFPNLICVPEMYFLILLEVYFLNEKKRMQSKLMQVLF